MSKGEAKANFLMVLQSVIDEASINKSVLHAVVVHEQICNELRHTKAKLMAANARIDELENKLAINEENPI